MVNVCVLDHQTSGVVEIGSCSQQAASLRCLLGVSFADNDTLLCARR